MLDIIDNVSFLNDEPEDIYFSKNIDKFGIKADFINAIKFSSEYFNNANSFGCHCIFYYNYKWKSLIYNNLINLI
jgi:hypothetical protein